MKFRTKIVEVEAFQWFKNGDHPLDDVREITDTNGLKFQSEGKIVRRYNHPENSGNNSSQCNNKMRDHGWVDTLEGGHIVCPAKYEPINN